MKTRGTKPLGNSALAANDGMFDRIWFEGDDAATVPCGEGHQQTGDFQTTDLACRGDDYFVRRGYVWSRNQPTDLNQTLAIYTDCQECRPRAVTAADSSGDELMMVWVAVEYVLFVTNGVIERILPETVPTRLKVAQTWRDLGREVLADDDPRAVRYLAAECRNLHLDYLWYRDLMNPFP